MCVNKQLNGKQSANCIHAFIKQFTIPSTLQLNTVYFYHGIFVVGASIHVIFVTILKLGLCRLVSLHKYLHKL